MNQNQLERYSFLWSEARLVIAAIALFMGGVPPLSLIFSAYTILNISWIISGGASAYLLYLWNASGRKVFGGNDSKDTAAFFVSVVSGINLGIVGILGRNIGMSISSNYIIFIITGLIYLASAFYLYKRWHERGQKLF